MSNIRALLGNTNSDIGGSVRSTFGSPQGQNGLQGSNQINSNWVQNSQQFPQQYPQQQQTQQQQKPVQPKPVGEIEDFVGFGDVTQQSPSKIQPARTATSGIQQQNVFTSNLGGFGGAQNPSFGQPQNQAFGNFGQQNQFAGFSGGPTMGYNQQNQFQQQHPQSNQGFGFGQQQNQGFSDFSGFNGPNQPNYSFQQSTPSPFATPGGTVTPSKHTFGNNFGTPKQSNSFGFQSSPQSKEEPFNPLPAAMNAGNVMGNMGFISSSPQNVQNDFKLTDEEPPSPVSKPKPNIHDIFNSEPSISNSDFSTASESKSVNLQSQDFIFGSQPQINSNQSQTPEKLTHSNSQSSQSGIRGFDAFNPQPPKTDDFNSFNPGPQAKSAFSGFDSNPVPAKSPSLGFDVFNPKPLPPASQQPAAQGGFDAFNPNPEPTKSQSGGFDVFNPNPNPAPKSGSGFDAFNPNPNPNPVPKPDAGFDAFNPNPEPTKNQPSKGFDAFNPNSAPKSGSGFDAFNPNPNPAPTKSQSGGFDAFNPNQSLPSKGFDAFNPNPNPVPKPDAGFYAFNPNPNPAPKSGSGFDVFNPNPQQPKAETPFNPFGEAPSGQQGSSAFGASAQPTQAAPSDAFDPSPQPPKKVNMRDLFGYTERKEAPEEAKKEDAPSLDAPPAEAKPPVSGSADFGNPFGQVQDKAASGAGFADFGSGFDAAFSRTPGAGFGEVGSADNQKSGFGGNSGSKGGFADFSSGFGGFEAQNPVKSSSGGFGDFGSTPATVGGGTESKGGLADFGGFDAPKPTTNSNTGFGDFGSTDVFKSGTGTTDAFKNDTKKNPSNGGFTDFGSFEAPKPVTNSNTRFAEFGSTDVFKSESKTEYNKSNENKLEEGKETKEENMEIKGGYSEFGSFDSAPKEEKKPTFGFDAFPENKEGPKKGSSNGLTDFGSMSAIAAFPSSDSLKATNTESFNPSFDNFAVNPNAPMSADSFETPFGGFGGASTGGIAAFASKDGFADAAPEKKEQQSAFGDFGGFGEAKQEPAKTGSNGGFADFGSADAFKTETAKPTSGTGYADFSSGFDSAKSNDFADFGSDAKKQNRSTGFPSMDSGFGGNSGSKGGFADFSSGFADFGSTPADTGSKGGFADFGSFEAPKPTTNSNTGFAEFGTGAGTAGTGSKGGFADFKGGFGDFGSTDVFKSEETKQPTNKEQSDSPSKSDFGGFDAPKPTTNSNAGFGDFGSTDIFKSESKTESKGGFADFGSTDVFKSGTGTTDAFKNDTKKNPSNGGFADFGSFEAPKPATNSNTGFTEFGTGAGDTGSKGGFAEFGNTPTDTGSKGAFSDFNSGFGSTDVFKNDSTNKDTGFADFGSADVFKSESKTESKGGFADFGSFEAPKPVTNSNTGFAEFGSTDVFKNDTKTESKGGFAEFGSTDVFKSESKTEYNKSSEANLEEGKETKEENMEIKGGYSEFGSFDSAPKENKGGETQAFSEFGAFEPAPAFDSFEKASDSPEKEIEKTVRFNQNSMVLPSNEDAAMEDTSDQYDSDFTEQSENEITIIPRVRSTEVFTGINASTESDNANKKNHAQSMAALTKLQPLHDSKIFPSEDHFFSRSPKMLQNEQSRTQPVFQVTEEEAVDPFDQLQTPSTIPEMDIFSTTPKTTKETTQPSTPPDLPSGAIDEVKRSASPIPDLDDFGNPRSAFNQLKLPANSDDLFENVGNKNMKQSLTQPFFGGFDSFGGESGKESKEYDGIENASSENIESSKGAALANEGFNDFGSFPTLGQADNGEGFGNFASFGSFPAEFPNDGFAEFPAFDEPQEKTTSGNGFAPFGGFDAPSADSKKASANGFPAFPKSSDMLASEEPFPQSPSSGSGFHSEPFADFPSCSSSVDVQRVTDHQSGFDKVLQDRSSLEFDNNIPESIVIDPTKSQELFILEQLAKQSAREMYAKSEPANIPKKEKQFEETPQEEKQNNAAFNPFGGQSAKAEEEPKKAEAPEGAFNPFGEQPKKAEEEAKQTVFDQLVPQKASEEIKPKEEETQHKEEEPQTSFQAPQQPPFEMRLSTEPQQGNDSFKPFKPYCPPQMRASQVKRVFNASREAAASADPSLGVNIRPRREVKPPVPFEQTIAYNILFTN